jgi:hypothetical protein
MVDATNNVSEDAKSAVLSGEDLRNKVRDITLNALSERKLDKESIRDVISSVTQGVGEGVSEPGERAQASVLQALEGVDDALQKSAQAAKLAAQEAIGRANDFTDHDVRAALDELSTLEEMFLETVKVVASQSGEVAAGLLTDVAGHLRSSGTGVGTQAAEAVDGLRKELKAVGRDTLVNAADAGVAVGEQMANIASGFLSGMADALQPKEKK